jgi:hypothetical protein
MSFTYQIDHSSFFGHVANNNEGRVMNENGKLARARKDAMKDDGGCTCSNIQHHQRRFLAMAD